MTGFLGIAAILVILIIFFRRKEPEWVRYHRLKYSINPLNAKQLEILRRFFPFYNQLPAKSKKIFEHKLSYFMHIKRFVGRRIPKVTEEMKVLISACAVQLTFGLPKIYMSHFNTIIVYPDAYYSQITQKYHKGEVNPRHRVIVLSWKAFVEGYIEKEGINLGLHEMAHALHLENRIRNHEYSFLPKSALAEWDRLSKEEMNHVRNGKTSFFREYGSVDSHEFFAVAVENFFERPKEFHDHSPKLYYLLTELLNQNPILLL